MAWNVRFSASVLAGVQNTSSVPNSGALALTGKIPGIAGVASYSTTFAATENPIVEDGGWVRGASEGGSWTDPKTTGGSCFGTMPVFDGSHYVDSIAHRTGFSANHEVTCTVFNSSAVSGQEIEGLLRFAITNGNARGYEWDCVLQPPIRLVLVRWNGAQNSFTPIQIFNQFDDANISFADGAVWKFRASGVNMIAICNGVQVASVDVQAWANANGGSYWSTGQPGMGYWNEVSPAANTNFGWKDWAATDI